MKFQTHTLLVCAVLLLGLRPASALDFYLDLSSYSEGNVTRGYGVSIHLDADFSDFDDFVDGFDLTSPGGDLFVAVSTESLNGSYGLLFPDFASATGAIYGEWTLRSTLVGFPLDTQTFRVESAGLAASDLPPARIVSPAFDATGVSATPLITFTGPADAIDINLGLSPETGSYPGGGFALLPGDATEYTPPFSLSAGLNEVFLIYYLPANDADKVTIGQPTGVAWSSSFTRASVANSQFTVSGAELKLSGPERVGNQFRWSFATEANRIYDVEYNDDLNTANWELLETINGDGSVKSFTVSPTQDARFFRIGRR